MIASITQSRRMCFNEKCFRSAITFEAGRGYMNFLGGNLRLNNFIFPKMLKLWSRTKHKFADRLLLDSNDRSSISGRSKNLNKAFVSMVNNSPDDVIGNGTSTREHGINGACGIFDAASACARFPSITLGHSPPVELYDEDCSFSENGGPSEVPGSIKSKWVDTDHLHETWPLRPGFPNATYPILQDENSSSHVFTFFPTLETEVKEDFHEYGVGSLVETQVTAASVELILDKSVSCIPGLGKKDYRRLDDGGFHTLRKLLHHFPRTYADLRNAHVGVDDGEYLIFIGKVLSSRGIRAGYAFSFLEVVVACEVPDGEATSGHVTDGIDNQSKRTIYIHLKKFFRGARFTFQPFLKSIQEKHKEGEIVCVSGKVKKMRVKNHYEMREYNIDVLQDEKDSSVRAKVGPYPIYPSKGSLTSSVLRDTISRALQVLPVSVDPIPENIAEDFGLLSLHHAYKGIHQPENLNEADLARKRLIFDEFFYVQLARLFQMLEGLGTQMERERLLDKYRNPVMNAVIVEEWSSLTKEFLNVLPYSLTSSQLNAVSEIIWDLKWAVPMNRLLQGDVGCGKTVVAFLACMEVIGSGYQAALMVPTELLALQHYEHIIKLLDNMDTHCKPNVALLTGSTPLKQSRLIRQGLQTGDISLVIGTHSLISENVEFCALRIAVVDEQQRFGVIQRGRFNSKLFDNSISSKMGSTNPDDSSKGDAYMAPHVLAMSATPIPRTLALALYGDMSLTQITDLPPGRIPVETIVVEGNEIGFEKVYQMMLDELEAGGKVYLVYPIIDQSDQLPQLRAASSDFETISTRFKGYDCGLLHGKMKSDEKDEALRRFRSGETRILLSTQVIEIGVDVPDASMMVVMNSERFGIAQLHQLRGRVGRGLRKSKCLLLASTVSSLNRLRVLEKSSDGFYLANMDLLLRGPGDLLGKKQSGHLPEFPVARLEVDGNILQEAHLAALKILGKSHDLSKFPELKAELSMRHPLSLLGD